MLWIYRLCFNQHLCKLGKITLVYLGVYRLSCTVCDFIYLETLV